MNFKQALIFSTSLLAFGLIASAAAAEPASPYVRLANLEIRPAEAELFRSLTIDHVEAAVRNEPGVLALHAVALKEDPGRVTVFEMYADEKAYAAHLKSAHFQRFVAGTKEIITKRTLSDVVPVYLGAKQTLQPNPLVRVAELEIHPAGLEDYEAAVKEEIESSIRVEPGVLAIYCTALKDAPNRLRFFEIYADEDAYRRHIDSPHFKAYVAATKNLIAARQLHEAVPIELSLRAH